MDIQLDDNFSLIIKDDLIFNSSNQQEINLLFQSELGDFKNEFQLGVGCLNYLNSTNLSRLKSSLFENAKLSNNSVNNIFIDENNNFKIDAND